MFDWLKGANQIVGGVFPGVPKANLALGKPSGSMGTSMEPRQRGITCILLVCNLFDVFVSIMIIF